MHDILFALKIESVNIRGLKNKVELEDEIQLLDSTYKSNLHVFGSLL